MEEISLLRSTSTATTLEFCSLQLFSFSGEKQNQRSSQQMEHGGQIIIDGIDQ